MNITNFIPTTVDEVKRRGWNYLDVILFTGDAYVDHPAFGVSIIARLLEKLDVRVAVVPQPNWRDDLRDFKKLGRPRWFFGVTAGNMDSMVNHYTANKRLRSNDAYTPGGKAGFRPDYASITYTRILKNLYPDIPVVLGGVEASLRRFTYYDYWSDSIKPSILYESMADLLIYGMAEKPLKLLIEKIRQGESLTKIRSLPQSAFIIKANEILPEYGVPTIFLNSYEQCKVNKLAFAENFKLIEQESNKFQPSRIIEPVVDRWVVVNPPILELSQDEIDEPYDLPYTRLPHPRYTKKSPIPAFDMIKNSVNIHRGCFGGCSFCTISMHQGKFIHSRSQNSILKEVQTISKMPYFDGVISDMGGPSANMYGMKGFDNEICKKCQRYSCISPSICKNLNTDYTALNNLYLSVRLLPSIKHVFIGSGIRYDLLYPIVNKQSADEYLQNLIKYHVCGRLKVAPEHSSETVLQIMRKPSFVCFEKFLHDFEKLCKLYKKTYQIIPYFISSHPGCTLKDMAKLAIVTKNLHIKLEQVQDFTPTPLTLSTCIYYTGIHPYTGEKIYTVRETNEKKQQQMFFFWYKPENRPMIQKILKQIGKEKWAQMLYFKKTV